MAQTHECPNHDQLKAFALGCLSAQEFHILAAHVQHCAACAQTLQRLDEHRDEFVECLRVAGGADVAAGDTLPLHLLDAVRSTGRDPAATDAAEVVVDAGERLARALTRGPLRLGRFELLEQLGAGSFGHVFRARDTELQRTVAIKVQRGGNLSDSGDSERFLREARSAAVLKHPHIIALFETGRTEDGANYLVSEYVAGETLEQLISRKELDPRTAARLVATIADALHYAHTQGVIHRDIKPGNLLVDAQGQPHIMDFGLAKRDATDVTVTTSGDVMGTPAYMSPEQARGEGHRVDPRSDVFSLGIVLYELLTAERPFQGHRRRILQQVMEEEPRGPRRLNERIPRDLETICLKAMAKAPARRYASALALAQDLRAFLEGEAICARPVGVFERLARWCRRNPLAATLGAAVVLGLTAGLVHLSRLSRQLLEQTALESAALHAEVLEHVNDLYSDAIATPMREHGVEVTHDYSGRAGAIPLPATFTIELGQGLRDSDYGMQLRLYSDHPFRSRKDGGPQDDFERAALASLRAQPAEPVHRFEYYKGHYSLRYATARRMQESCVECHNQHPDSTRTDWRVGDVRGVLEIIHPLGRDMERTRAGLRGTFVLVLAISGAFTLLAVAVAVIGQGRRKQRAAGGGRT